MWLIYIYIPVLIFIYGLFSPTLAEITNDVVSDMRKGNGSSDWVDLSYTLFVWVFPLLFFGIVEALMLWVAIVEKRHFGTGDTNIELEAFWDVVLYTIFWMVVFYIVGNKSRNLVKTWLEKYQIYLV
jgi:hypothetical protein